jgi:hypothetical protein
LKGNNNYPQTPTEAYNLLVNYKNYLHNNKKNPGYHNQVAFMTKKGQTGTEGETGDNQIIVIFNVLNVVHMVIIRVTVQGNKQGHSQCN